MVEGRDSTMITNLGSATGDAVDPVNIIIDKLVR
jgi:hypothetical protein